MEKIEELIEEKDLLKNKILLILLDDPETDRNLSGLIANQLMSKYQKPVLLLSVVETENGEIAWSGSGRGYEQSKLKDFKSFLSQCPYTEMAEGHPNAFGFSVLDKNIKAFIDFTNSQLVDFDFSPSYDVDFIWNTNDMIPEDVIEIAGMKCLWGQGVAEAEVAVENIKIHKDNIMLMSPDRNPTLKITLPNGISFVKFKSSEEEYNRLYSDLGSVTINIVGECERNIWNNKISP